MPEIVGAVNEVGGVVLTNSAFGVSVKNAAAAENPIITWDQVSGNVMVAPAVGSSPGGGTRFLRLNATTGIIGHAVVGDLAENLSNPHGWSRMLQVRGGVTVALSLFDIDASGGWMQQWDIGMTGKNLEIYDAYAAVHLMVMSYGTGDTIFSGKVTVPILMVEDIAIGHGTSTALQRNDNLRVGGGVLGVNTTGQYIAGFGTGALVSNTTGSWNAAFGRSVLSLNIVGSFNTGVGGNALLKSNGSDNTGVGALALQLNETGSRNTSIGAWSGLTAVNLSGLVLIGAHAGRYEIALSDSLYIDNQDRLNTAAEKTGALLYGRFNANPALQTLTINAKLTIAGLGTGPLLVGAVDSDGVGFRRVRTAN